jgi:hypothetical protein
MVSRDRDTHTVIERAVHNYFAYQTDLNHREFRNLLREGRISLIIGLSVLSLCLSGAEVLAGLELPGTKVLQSLSTCGWVAMWHPMETYFYRVALATRGQGLSQAQYHTGGRSNPSAPGASSK